MPSNLDPSVGLLINRLTSALSDDDRVNALERELVEAREEVDRILLHARQMQESLEQLLHDDQAKQSQLDELEHQVALLQRRESEAVAEQAQLLEQELAKAVAEQTQLLEQELAKAKQQCQEKTLKLEKANQKCQEKDVKLVEALEELEHYFLQGRQQSMMLLEYEKLQARASGLLLKTT